MKVKALNNKVLVTMIERGERKLNSGIVLPNDDGKDSGIRHRWAHVYSVGDDIRDISVGQWILIDHGRWTRGVEVRDDSESFVIYQVDWPAGALLVSDERPVEFGSKV